MCTKKYSHYKMTIHSKYENVKLPSSEDNSNIGKNNKDVIKSSEEDTSPKEKVILSKNYKNLHNISTTLKEKNIPHKIELYIDKHNKITLYSKPSH